ncbi:MAG: dephospho-CoA kinase [Oscillospiraceae bacterium]|nr:dephospho-CoA kinase [Oscillospiraceae bacterium]
MFTIGITGGSGSGKSTVAALFCEKGARTIDADIVYHDLLEGSDAMMRSLARRFPEALNSSGKINRRALADIVFSNKDALSDLNAIAHKFVIDETEKTMAKLYEENVEYLCIDAIALFESEMNKICDVTVGVIAPRALRISRIIERDGIDTMAASARISAQPEDSFYKEKCDFILTNNGDIDELKNEAEKLFNTITKGPEKDE